MSITDTPDLKQAAQQDSSQAKLAGEALAIMNNHFALADRNNDNYVSRPELDGVTRLAGAKDVPALITFGQEFNSVAGVANEHGLWSSRKGISLDDLAGLRNLIGEMPTALDQARRVKQLLDNEFKDSGGRPIVYQDLLRARDNQKYSGKDAATLTEAQDLFRHIGHAPLRNSTRIDQRDLDKWYSGINHRFQPVRSLATTFETLK